MANIEEKGLIEVLDSVEILLIDYTKKLIEKLTSQPATDQQAKNLIGKVGLRISFNKDDVDKIIVNSLNKK